MWLSKASRPLNIMKAFRRAGFISRWDGAAENLACHIDPDCAKDVRRWNQAKTQESVVLVSRLDEDNRESSKIPSNEMKSWK
jgi:hypothetical protein